MKRIPTPFLLIWLLGVLAVPLLLVAGVAGAQAPGTTCASGKYVFGGTFSVPLPAGDYDIHVRTWDRYDNRANSWPGDQTSERIAVAGRTTPDLADGVDAADWSGTWRWTSPGTLTVDHVRPDNGAHSVSWEVCATPVEPEPAPTTTVPEVVEDVPEPESGEVEEVPVEVLPETVVAEPVQTAPAFTG